MIDTIAHGAPPDVAALEKLNAAQERIRQQIRSVVVGQDAVVEQLLVSIFAGGHCILEGVPGLAKTLLVQTLAKSLSRGGRICGNSSRQPGQRWCSRGYADMWRPSCGSIRPPSMSASRSRPTASIPSWRWSSRTG